MNSNLPLSQLLRSILLVSPVPSYIRDIDPLLPLREVPLDDPLTALLEEFESSKPRNDDATSLDALRRFGRFCCRKNRRGDQDDRRSVIAMLELVENAFMTLDKVHGFGGKFLQDLDHFNLYHNTLTHLSELCHRSMPRNVKTKAGDVIGRIGKWDWRGLGEGEGATRALEMDRTYDKKKDPMKCLKCEMLRR